MLNKKVKDLMTNPAITCSYDQTIKEAINIMKENDIGFLPITKNNIIVGVVTDRDILIRAIGIHKINTKINKVMTNGEIHFVSPETNLIDAAKIMSKSKVRRLVVLNNGEVTGVLTSKSFINEPQLIPYIIDTYKKNDTIGYYEIYNNSNPHDSIKTDDFPL